MGLSSICFTYKLFVFIPALVYLAHFTCSMQQQPLCHEDESSALLQFKQSLSISQHASSDPSAYPKVASWKLEESSDCCFWDGIGCGEETANVIRIDLASSYLYGSINSSSSLFKLDHLQWLSLADNDFNHSEIPSGIVNLPRLWHLNFSFSAFSGQVPFEILELSSLVSLDLSENWLSLQKPDLRSLVERLTNLKILDLSYVDISSSVPDIMTNLSAISFLSLRHCGLHEFDQETSSLTYLDINKCNFTRKVPSSIANLTKLVHLKIAVNNFSSELPISIGNLASLEELDIGGSYFSGQIPYSLSNLSHRSFLDLSFNNFSGPSSHSLSWIGKSTKLTRLGLSGLNLDGEIPPWLMNLTLLDRLEMSHNQLNGPIPYWFMNLNQLAVLTLKANQLTGNIPSQIRNLTQLRCLQISLNQLEGPIPVSIFDIKSLKWIDLYSNNLSGTFKLEMILHNLKRLEVLDLSLNSLTVLTETAGNSYPQKFWAFGLGSCHLDKYPNFLHNQDELLWLDLSSNNISGQIPGWLLNISIDSPESLNLSYNHLTGFDQYPVVLPWNRLITLDLRSNEMQGSLPVPPLSTSSYLVSNNKLTGEIPPLICNLKQLQILDLSYNNLRGMLPQCLENFSYHLSLLKLQNNQFQGSISQIFTDRTKLRMVDLSYNQFQGRIPRSLANCSMLEFLDLGNNQISDTFPSWLGSLPNLEILVLQSNNFHGEIKEPETDFEFPKLRILDLSHNQFTGKLPSKYIQFWNAMKIVNASRWRYMEEELLPSHDLHDFTYFGLVDYSLIMDNKRTKVKYWKISNILTGIILSNNKFEGEIPASTANLKGLHCLNLSNNNLQGDIPSSFGSLTELESLDLSHNMLSGEIPQQLADLTFLAYFVVSYNHLTGPIPQGKQFDTFDNSSFDGNPGLCGKPLSKKCEDSKTSEIKDTGSDSFFAFGWQVVLIGYGCGLIAGVALGTMFIRRKPKWLVKVFGLPRRRVEKRNRRHRN